MKLLAFHAHAGDPLSFLIKAITRSQYCHGAVFIDRPESRVIVEKRLQDFPPGYLIIEAFWPKVRARLLDDKELSSIDVFEIVDLTPAQEAAGVEWLIDQVEAGVKYDVPDLFRFLPVNRAVIGESSDIAYKQHTFCSMLCFNAVRFSGHAKLLNCHDYEFSPDKIPWSPFVAPSPTLKPIPIPLKAE